MRTWLGLVLVVSFAALLAGYGCCKGCGDKLLIDTDKIPGMKDSGIVDPHAVKEHQAEIEELNKEIQELANEQKRVMTDPTLSPEEKERRLKEIQNEMQPKVERLAEMGADMLNKEGEVKKEIEEWHKEKSGK